MKKAKEVYVQIGVTALRSIAGDFLPSVPLYIKVPQKSIKESGLTETEEEICLATGGLFLKAHREYMKLLHKEEASYAKV